jgi:hypothetical protein
LSYGTSFFTVQKTQTRKITIPNQDEAKAVLIKIIQKHTKAITIQEMIKATRMKIILTRNISMKRADAAVAWTP